MDEYCLLIQIINAYKHAELWPNKDKVDDVSHNSGAL